MGYSTWFNLEVTNRQEQEQIPMTIETVMKEFENDKLGKKEMLEKLAQIRDGMSSEVLDDEIIIRRLRDENEEAAYCLNNDGSGRDNGRWYDAREDLKAFSRQYPGWLFTLQAKGEESGDIWISYCMNGKEQYTKARIVLDEFDQSKLV
jgi:hypothetical protein